MTNDLRILTWSSGGGVQSTAIAVLVAQGRLPKPDAIVIADTGREQSAVWAYLEAHVQPLLATVGLRVEIAPHSLATVDLYGKNRDVLIPAFTRTGKLPTYCSNEWKRRVVLRYLRQQGYGPRRPVETWIGISLDEADRMKPSDTAWQSLSYPLIDLAPMTRQACYGVVASAGLPKPPRSSCWMCPHHTNAEWRQIRDHAPKDWQRALALERSLQAQDAGLSLHRSGQPLGEAPIDEDQRQLSFALEECGGVCFL
jgi:hypothetical protein